MAQINDTFENSLNAEEAAALKLTDAVIGLPAPLSSDLIEELKVHYSEAELLEMTVGVSLFMSMSKVLIALGLEPENMDTTLMPTPGS